MTTRLPQNICYHIYTREMVCGWAMGFESQSLMSSAQTTWDCSHERKVSNATIGLAMDSVVGHRMADKLKVPRLTGQQG